MHVCVDSALSSSMTLFARRLHYGLRHWNRRRFELGTAVLVQDLLLLFCINATFDDGSTYTCVLTLNSNHT